ncbi:MAG: isoprenylcysteine carboxylmethyltransferase family protein [Saprospiraceae bacterium]|nr:isoprenylcysteine carboxylmethyltransferase family protein [Saprospiraceae bacterium]
MFFKTSIAFILGILFAIIGLIILIPAVVKFFKTKNTLITIKPAKSLQTTGIYSITRNPMYLGLLNIYTGIAFFKGNWWTLMLIPIVILTITYLVILKEEKYMARAFGNLYVEYSKNVRRWI